MSDEGWGFADMYAMDDEVEEDTGALTDVSSDDWRNILVVGRASGKRVFGETLALIGHGRSLADELGCRLEVVFFGDNLDAAIEQVKQYPVDTIYTVPAPDYTPIDYTSKLLAEVVRKRRPELVLLFQTRTGDAVTAYAASLLGVGHVLGGLEIQLDTNTRLAEVVHQGSENGFKIRSKFLQAPQFVSIQQESGRAPIEDPYRNPTVHELELDVGKVADVEVKEQRAPAETPLGDARRVVIAGGQIRTQEEYEKAKELASAMDAHFAVTRGLVDRGIASEDTPVVGKWDACIAPKLLVCVATSGSLDLLEQVHGNPTIVAIGGRPSDPLRKHATYSVEGETLDAVQSVIDGL